MLKKILEQKICRACDTPFDIVEDELIFLGKLSPAVGGETYKFPTPSHCPDCRQRLRLAFFNERKLYRRNSDFSGKPLISMYSPDKSMKVYDSKEWWGGTFDGLTYGRIYKQGVSFFKQFQDLSSEVPRLALIQVNCENAEYNNYLENSKNSYLSISSQDSEDIQYVSSSIQIKKSLDCWWSGYCENSYELFNCARMMSSYFCSGCEGGYALYFCDECISCENCLFCYGLYNKKYHIFNKEYSKEEYEKKLAELTFFTHDSIAKYEKLFAEFALTLPHKYSHEERNEKCLGDYMYGNKNCENAFSIVDIENGKYLYECGRVSNLYDCGNFYDGEGASVGSVTIQKGTKIYFSSDISNSSDILYSQHLYNCHNCFGCTGLKNKEHCILNKQYTKEEYETLVPEIIASMEKTGEWGEFFPANLSAFGYNETVAQEYFPLSKEQATTQGFNWSDYETPFPQVSKIIPGEKLPGSIADIPDDILNWAIQCEVTKRPFKIVKEELEFYRSHKLPIPRRHPDVRHLNRLEARNPRILFERKCDKCSVDISSTYAPERKEKVFCAECYKKEIF